MDFPSLYAQIPMSPFMGPGMPMGSFPPFAFGTVDPVTGLPFGFGPTVEQREEYAMAFLNDQKQYITQLKAYLQECHKALDASLEVIEKETAKLKEAKAQRQKAGTTAGNEARQKS